MAIATINPTTGETIKTFAVLSEAELEAKLARAETAFAQHRRTSFADRAGKLLAAAEIFESEKDRLAALMTLEMGKPIKQAQAEAAKCATACRYYAKRAETFLADEPIPEAEGRCHIRYEPLGAVLAIMPWNFPFWQVVRFAAPTLVAGNVGLLKHAANVPQCAFALEEIFLRAGFAEGCFQNLPLENEVVARVIEDERVAAVTLTGSVGAGSAVAALAGKLIKPTVLELGGSDPFIVMPSALLTETVKNAVQARVQNNGQSCIAAKRFIVHADIYDAFEKQFVAAFEKLRVGDPALPETEIGPLAQARAVDTLEKQVRAGVEAGAKILTGAASASPALVSFLSRRFSPMFRRRARFPARNCSARSRCSFARAILMMPSPLPIIPPSVSAPAFGRRTRRSNSAAFVNCRLARSSSTASSRRKRRSPLAAFATPATGGNWALPEFAPL